MWWPLQERCPLKSNVNKSVQPATAAVNVALSAFAAAAPCCGDNTRRPPLSIDISSPRCAQRQTRHTPLLRSIDGTAGRTDGRTLLRILHVCGQLTTAVTLVCSLFLSRAHVSDIVQTLNDIARVVDCCRV